MVPHNLLLASCVVFIFKGGIFILKENERIKELKRKRVDLESELMVTPKEDPLRKQIATQIESVQEEIRQELRKIAYETEKEKAIDRRTTALEEKDQKAVLEKKKQLQDQNKLIEDTMVNHPGVLEENKGRKR